MSGYGFQPQFQGVPREENIPESTKIVLGILWALGTIFLVAFIALAAEGYTDYYYGYYGLLAAALILITGAAIRTYMAFEQRNRARANAFTTAVPVSTAYAMPMKTQPAVHQTQYVPQQPGPYGPGQNHAQPGFANVHGQYEQNPWPYNGQAGFQQHQAYPPPPS